MTKVEPILLIGAGGHCKSCIDVLSILDTTIMTTILFLGGLQISLFSILGEYLWRILDQVRNRPSYIIEKISKNNK